MKKRILTMLLAVCLVLALGTVSALADGEAGDAQNEITYSDPDILKAKLQNPGGTSENPTEIVLGSNVTIKGKVTVTGEEHYFILDLAGHTLTFDATTTTPYNTSESSVHITIIDSSMNNSGIIQDHETDRRGDRAIFNIDDDDTLTVKGGTVLNRNGGGAINVDGGSVIIDDKAVIKNSVTGAESNSNVIMASNGANVTINGGQVYNAVDSNSCAIRVQNGASVTVNKGEIKSDSSGSVFTVTPKKESTPESTTPTQVNISGGTITTAGTQLVDVDGTEDVPEISVNNAEITTTSGDNNALIEEVTDYVPEGGEVVVNDTTVTNEGAVYEVSTAEELKEAIANVPEGGTIEIIDDILDVDLNDGSGQNGVFNINSGMAFTINGNRHTIRVSTDHDVTDTNVHVFNVTNGKVTFNNLTVDGGGYARHGIQAHGTSAEVILNNVTSINNEGYGVIANAGGTVTANYLTTNGNGWGGVNVEANGQTSTFNMKDGNLKENASIVFEDEDGTGSANAKLDGGNFNTLEVKTANVSIDINGGSYDSIVVADDVTLASGVITVDGASFNEPVSGIAETEDYQVYYGGVYSYYDSFSKAWNAVGRGNANAAIAYVGEGSSTAAEVVTFKVGEKTVTYTVPYGFELSLPSPYNYSSKFLGWECSRDGDLYKVNAKYTVYRDVTFTATYEVTGYNIYIDRSIENGEVSTSPSGSAAAGETVYIYVDPDTGYVLDELTASWGYNYRYELSLRSVRDGVYRFTMPEGNVYITATFERSNLRMPFTDVNRGDWFYDAVYYVWANDMMEGVSDTSFNPNGSMTRAMFWAVLGRIDGETITGSDWVEEARDWAMSEGVSDGENPYALVTREQMVTMLWRYAGEPGRSANLNRYTDAGSISDWAEDAMEWAIARGVIDGMTSNTLQPQGTATRAHCATIFMRYDQL